MAPRELGLGNRSSAFGAGGVEKRLAALGGLTTLTGDRLLDVGCADGSYTLRLAEGFRAVDAVDIEPERLDDFRAKLADHPQGDKITLAEMSAEKLDFDDETFDVVTTIEVLEHVGDLDATIKEIARVLRPGGRFLITSPNRYFPFETHGFDFRGRRMSPAKGPFLPWVSPLHERLADARTFTVRTLGADIESHGFRRVGYDYIMPPFDRSSIGRKIKPVLDRVERSPLKFFGMALILVFRKV